MHRIFSSSVGKTIERSFLLSHSLLRSIEFRGFRTTGPFVVMIYTMIRGDLLRFCLIFLVFMIGFTQALHVLFVRIECDNDFSTVIGTFFNLFCVTLQQVTDAYENFNRHPSEGLQVIGKVRKSSMSRREDGTSSDSSRSGSSLTSSLPLFSW